jgi:phosphotransferase system HPr (HPr) family protein
MSYCGMKRSKVVVLWQGGLHLRPAVKLVQVAKQFQSTIHLKCGSKIADLRSILSVIALCATMGTGLEIEVSGDDEQDAAQAIEQVFSSHASGEGANISRQQKP